jgi:threonyl-tRNA synthetase
MMGCPEVPVQMSIVLYMAARMRQAGMEVVVAGTDAALNLAKVADPERHYLKRLINIDKIIEDLVEKKREFDIACAFAHSDAGIAYAATLSAISSGKVYAIIFGRNAMDLADCIDFDCTIIAEKAVHSPMALRKKIDEVFGWDASKN